MDLEQLLSDLEHAGRDTRRQQELGDMIDRMAGAERKRGFWWWGARVAAAACILFFISTAVRIWFIPTGSGVEENLMAQHDMPEAVPVLVDTLPVAAVAQQPARTRRIATRTAATMERMEEHMAEEAVPESPSMEVEPVEMADTVISTEEVMSPEPMPIAQAEERPTDGVDAIVAPMVSVGATAEAPAVESKPRRESIFKSLFRRDDISKMDGTMLAFNIL